MKAADVCHKGVWAILYVLVTLTGCGEGIAKMPTIQRSCSATGEATADWTLLPASQCLAVSHLDVRPDYFYPSATGMLADGRLLATVSSQLGDYSQAIAAVVFAQREGQWAFEELGICLASDVGFSWMAHVDGSFKYSFDADKSRILCVIDLVANDNEIKISRPFAISVLPPWSDDLREWTKFLLAAPPMAY